ncbi:hypothetical protein DFH09DRAFT_1119014, partial [Mycena vulgaris]
MTKPSLLLATWHYRCRSLLPHSAPPRAMVSIGGPLPGLCKGYTPYGLFAASGPWLHRMSQDPDITHQKERLVEILQAAWVIGNDTSDPKSLAAVFVQRILALATVPTLNAPNPGVDFINSNSLQAFLKLPGVHGNPHINVKGIRDALRDVMLPLRVFDALLHVLDRRAEPDVLMSIATECYAPEVPPSPPKHPIGSTLRTHLGQLEDWLKHLKAADRDWSNCRLRAQQAANARSATQGMIAAEPEPLKHAYIQKLSGMNASASGSWAKTNMMHAGFVLGAYLAGYLPFRTQEQFHEFSLFDANRWLTMRGMEPTFKKEQIQNVCPRPNISAISAPLMVAIYGTPLALLSEINYGRASTYASGTTPWDLWVAAGNRHHRRPHAMALIEREMWLRLLDIAMG